MRSFSARAFVAVAFGSVAALAGVVHAGVVVANYTANAGGSNNSPLNGLAAKASFFTSGTSLTIELGNTSTGLPAGFDNAASLLVTLGFNLPADVNLTAGNSALIAPGSVGIGGWAARSSGASVADNWIWSNNYGGDLLNADQSLARRQIISTSQGIGGGIATRFDLGDGTVSGPSGGIAAAPLLTPIGGLYGVSSKIVFTLTTSRALTDAELNAVANGGAIEFGSDVRYLVVPAPGSAIAVGIGFMALARRRR